MPRGRPGDNDGERAELSCNACRDRKIRCNRVLPCCDKCKAIDAPCHYPARKQRSKRVLNTEEALKNIFERLEHLELTVANAISNGTLQSDGGGGGHAYRSQAESSCDDHTPPEIGPRETTLPVDRQLQGSLRRSVSASDSSISAAEVHSPGSPSLAQLVCEATNLARAMLAVKPSARVQACEEAVLERLEQAETETVDIQSNGFGAHGDQQELFLLPPKEQAQAWVEKFFKHAPDYYFFSFRLVTSDDFILQIAELKDNPNVSLEPACLLTYYSLCHQGLCLDESDIPNRAAYARGLYKACLDQLEPWRQKTSNFTAMDIVAAVGISLFSWRFLDHNLALRIFHHGCSIAEKLGVFNTDDPNYSHTQSLSETEKTLNRILFWQLFQFDSSFSMQAGKPPAIKNGSWKVDLPTDFSPWEGRITQTHRLLFFALTRLAQSQRKLNDLFALSASVKSSFSMEPDPEQHQQHVAALSALVAEVQDIHDSLQLTTRYQTATNPTHKWYYGDLLFNFHTTMTLVYRAGCGGREHMSCFPTPALHSARQAIHLMREFYGNFPRGLRWNIGFVCLHPFIPFFTLFCNVIVTDDLDVAREDLALTTWLCNTVRTARKECTVDVALNRFEAVIRKLNGVGDYFIHLKAAGGAEWAQQHPHCIQQAAADVGNAEGLGDAGGAEDEADMGDVGLREVAMDGLNLDFDLGEFLVSPMEYARMLETGVVTMDTHAEWWGEGQGLQEE